MSDWMLKNSSYSSFQVVWPTMPSTVRPYLRWKARTALAVAVPNTPSTFTDGMALSYCASVFSQNCTCSTALPEAPVLSTVPFHVPLDRVPVEVSPSLVSSARSFTDT